MNNIYLIEPNLIEPNLINYVEGTHTEFQHI